MVYQLNECDFDRPTKKKNQYHIRFYITWIRGIQGTTENLKKKNLINDSLSKYVEQSKYEGTEECLSIMNGLYKSIDSNTYRIRKQYLTIVHQVQQKEPNKNTKKKYTFY